MSDPRKYLYDIHPVGSESQNAMAHPGGGTETVEIASGEGLVEDLYESHLVALEIAYSTPVASELAKLANDLEDQGLVSLANNVDDTLANFVKQANPLMKELRDALGVLRSIIRGADFGLVASMRDAKSIMKSWISDVESNTRMGKYDDALIAVNRLGSEELLTGSFGQIYEVDLENDLTEDNYFEWVRNVAKTKAILEQLGQPKSAPEETHRQRVEKESVQPAATPKVPAKVPEFSPESKQRYDMLMVEVSKINDLWTAIDYQLDERSGNIIDADQLAKYEASARSITQRYIQTLTYWKKHREAISSPHELSMRRYGDVLSVVNRVLSTLVKMNSELDRAYNASVNG